MLTGATVLLLWGMHQFKLYLALPGPTVDFNEAAVAPCLQEGLSARMGKEPACEFTLVHEAAKA